MSSSASPDPAAVARALRQRLEVGAPPLVLSTLDRAEVLRLVSRAAEIRRRAAANPASPIDDGSTVERAVASGRPPTSAPERSAPTRPEAGRERSIPGGPAAPPDPSAMDAAALEEAVLGCTRCRLSETRTRAVHADGSPDARVVVVGEAPGANEDRTGLPFVGAAGKLLDLMLASVDLSRRESVYICNVIKCRPPGNRNPLADEIDTCSPYLRRQIELVAPEAILAVGTFAARFVTGAGDAALGALRGRVHAFGGVPAVVTYHPAALLRNRSWTRPAWDDLQLLRRILEGA